MWVIGKVSRRRKGAHCRFARATGTAASPSLVGRGFRTAHGFEMGRMASDVPHRRATRS